jgi:hypothetical protein
MGISAASKKRCRSNSNWSTRSFRPADHRPRDIKPYDYWDHGLASRSRHEYRPCPRVSVLHRSVLAMDRLFIQGVLIEIFKEFTLLEKPMRNSESKKVAWPNPRNLKKTNLQRISLRFCIVPLV